MDIYWNILFQLQKIIFSLAVEMKKCWKEMLKNQRSYGEHENHAGVKHSRVYGQLYWLLKGTKSLSETSTQIVQKCLSSLENKAGSQTVRDYKCLGRNEYRVHCTFSVSVTTLFVIQYTSATGQSYSSYY